MVVLVCTLILHPFMKYMKSCGCLENGEVLARAGKKCRLVDNIGARLGSKAYFGSHTIKISS